MLRRCRPNRGHHDDAGQATLEYVGALFVVVLLVAAVLATATPVGNAVAAKICEALGASCGGAEAAARERAEALGITCVVARRDNELGANASYVVRAEHTTKGSLSTFGDGTGQVTLSDNQGVGAEASFAGTRAASAKVSGTVNGELGLVYKFPEEYGGAEGAGEFFGDRRDVKHNIAGLVVPGAQVMEEGFNRARDGIGSLIGKVTGGDGPNPEEQREQAARNADAVEVSVSLQGNAGATFGAGAKKKTGNTKPDGSDETEDARAPASVNADAKGNVKGTMTVPLHTDGPDAVDPAFAGELGGDVTAGGSLGGVGPVPPMLQGVWGAQGKLGYKVTYDQDGNPKTLTLTREGGAGGGGYVSPKIYDNGAKAKVGGRRDGVTVTSSVLDLDPSTPQGAANLAAYNQAFDTQTVQAGNITGVAAVPKGLVAPGYPGGVNGVELVRNFSALQQRVDADAFTTTSTYDSDGSEYGGDIKAFGVGIGGKYGETERQLTGSTAHDNRTGADVQLASCPGS